MLLPSRREAAIWALSSLGVAFCDLLGKVGGATFEVDVTRGQAARSAVPTTISVGQVVGIYIADDVIADGMIGVTR